MRSALLRMGKGPARGNSRTPLRIASLAPNATSILLAIGARKAIVGVSQWCQDIADVGRLPRLGDCWSLDVKQVTKLHPNLVIGSVPFKADTISKLLEQPVAFLALNPRSLADVDSDIRLLGSLVGRSEEAEELIASMHADFKEIAQQVRRAKTRPRVYSEAWPNPRISSPPWVRELIEIAGGRPVVPCGKCVTDSEVARAKPDVIVLAWTATGDQARREKALENPAWQHVPAVRNGRVVVIRDELLNTPGPPLIAGARDLARVFHPEIAQPGRKT
jgi:iron complex transport system substrate-binding protein